MDNATQDTVLTPDFTTISTWNNADYNLLTADLVSSMTIAQIQALQHPEWIPATAVSGMTATQISSVTASFAIFSPDWLNGLSISAFQALSGTQLNQLTPATFALLDNAHLSALSATQVSALTVLSGLNSAQFGLLNIAQMTTSTIAHWSQTQYLGVTAQQISTLSTAQIYAMQHTSWMPASAATAFTAAQVQSIYISMYWFSADWLNNLSISAFQGMTPAQSAQITSSTLSGLDNIHLSALTAAQVGSMNNFDGLSSAQFSLLNISRMPNAVVSGWTLTEYSGLTAQQIATLNRGQVQAMQHPEWIPVSAVAGFTSSQTPSLTNDFSALSSDWLNALTLPAFQAVPAEQLGEINATALSNLDSDHQSALEEKAPYIALTAQQISAMSGSQLQALTHQEWIPISAASGLSAEQVAALTVNFSLYPVAWFNNLTASALRAITVTELNQIDPIILTSLDNNHLSALSASQVVGIANINVFNSAQFGLLDISALPATALSSWTTTQYVGVTAQQITTLTPAQFLSIGHTDQINAPAMNGATAAQMAILSSWMFYYYSTAWLNNLSVATFQTLTSAQLNQIQTSRLAGLDNTHLSALTATQVAGMTHLSSLSGAQFALLDISGMSAAGLNALSITQLQSISAVQIAQLSATTLSNLDSAHLSVINEKKTYITLTAQQVSALTVAQIQGLAHPEWIPTTALSGLTPVQITAFSASLSACSADWLNNLSTQTFQAITNNQINQISATTLSGLDASHLSALTATQTAAMTTSLATLSSAWFNGLNIPAFQAISSGKLNLCTAATLSGLDNSHISALTATQLGGMTISFSSFPASWLNALSTQTFKSLSATQINQISNANLAALDDTHLSALTAAQVGAMTHLGALSSAQFGMLDISLMPTSVIANWSLTEYHGLTAKQISTLSPAQVSAIVYPSWMNGSAAAGFTAAQVPSISATFYWFTGAWLNNMSIPAFQAMTVSQAANVTQETLQGLNDAHLSALSAAQTGAMHNFAKLSSAQFALLDISQLTASAISGWSGDNYNGLTAKQITSLSPAQINAMWNTSLIPAALAGSFTADQVQSISTSLYWFSADWLNNLSIPAFQGMTPTQASQITSATLSGLDNAHLSALTAAQVGGMNNFGSLSSDQFGLLNISQMPTSVISYWSGTEYTGITAQQIASLSIAQTQAISHTDWIPATAASGFTASQIQSFTLSFYWFTGSWLNNLSIPAFQAMTLTQAGQITQDTLQGLDDAHLSALSAAQVGVMNNFGRLTSAQFGLLNISALPVSVIIKLNQTEYAGLTAQQISTLSTDQIQALQHADWLSSSAAAGVTAAQMPYFGHAVSQLSSAFINNLSPSAFQAMTVDQFTAMKPSAIVGLNAELLSTLTDRLTLLNADELLSVSPSLSTPQLGLLSQAQRSLLSVSGSTGDSLLNSLSDASLKSIMTSVAANNSSLFSFTAIESVLKDFVAGMTDTLTAAQYSDLSSYAQNIGSVCGTSSPIYSIVNGMVTGAGGASVDWTSQDDGTLTRIGCLGVGSSATQFSQLIANWMDGTNKPASSSTANTQGRPLFADGGPTINDICQGQVGDCSLLSALQAVVDADPNFIKSMIVQNPNDTYSVRFFNNGVPTWVTVDNNEFSSGASVSSSSWVAIAERANVAFEATYWNDNNSYSSLPGGFEKLQAITGDSNTTFWDGWTGTTENTWNTTYFERLKTAVLNGAPAQLSSWESSTNATTGQTNFVGGHAFAIIGFDAATNDFILTNPWGAFRTDGVQGTFEASMDQMWQHGNFSTGIAFANSNGASGAAGQLVTAMATMAATPGASSGVTPALPTSSAPLLVKPLA
ncbi:hypothetical protein M977_04642 [Buttiauxella gaviniae ATCC 51604]|uniref:Calpain catalytic domain-containing protein n=1 Tax=Buttiauxella gaviniae ATCC 51604 TaxID=1354253 RepID=A0A1B7HL91_9ENTR|nr:C2 family cysteine protease [Buttiauxella gaviniae]OAT16326.1 hypothetical protein M977_04642 [Buttiauxella gaviniae ATCC 51604]